MRDPESVRMAAFTSNDPDDRTAFETHMAKVRTSHEVTTRAITADGRLAGSIASFVVDGEIAADSLMGMSTFTRSRMALRGSANRRA